MICQRCLLRLACRPSFQIRQPVRAFTTSCHRLQTPVTAQTTTATNPRPNDVAAATSTSAAQPFSTPLSPSPERHETASDRKPSAPRVQSSVPAGTVLKGLNFMKNKPDPIALEDHEYPEWLWTVLDPKKEEGIAGATQGEGDLFSKSKKQRRIAAKALRRQQRLDPSLMIPKVPLEEQTLDLPSGDGTPQGAQEANAAREELTKAMRNRRRKAIKEANFLKSMS